MGGHALTNPFLVTNDCRALRLAAVDSKRLETTRKPTNPIQTRIRPKDADAEVVVMVRAVTYATGAVTMRTRNYSVLG